MVTLENDSTVNMTTSYRCPRTHAELHAQSAALRGGQAAYPIRDGVPVFLSGQSPAPAVLAGVRLTDLLAAARTEGWLQALRSSFGHDSHLLKYITADSRGDFLGILPLKSESKVLEIGPGLGQMTRKLATRARSVDVMEISEEQAQFVKLSCEQSGLDNVAVACGGDDCRLPYADEQFDLVVLNLVFEWCGSRFQGDHETAQRTLLHEMHRVLKRGGSLYLATKNRFGLRLLMGKQDEHFHGMKFGSCLPRGVGAALLERKGHRRSSGYLHSFNELQSLLAQAGFGATRSYWPAPEVRYPERYIPVDPPSIRQQRRAGGFRQGEGRLENVLMKLVPAPMVKHLSHGLAVLATKV